MNRMSIRVRLTAVFVVVMGVVLAAIGSYLYLQTKHNIDGSIEQSLRAREGALRSFAAHPPGGSASSIPPGERFAQLLRPDGSVVESRPQTTTPLLSPAQAAAASRRAGVFELHERDRYFAGPATVAGAHAVAVAGASLADHERALEGLGGALLIGGPLALLIGAAVAYAIASGALRPVEHMRARAASIGAAHADAMLPVPEAEDELRRLSTTLNEMLARLARSAEAERRLIANASHELRTPLAALQAELELADRDSTTHSELRDAVRRARGDASRLVQLSNALLEVSALDAGAPLATRAVAVQPLLDAAAIQVREVARQAGRDVTVLPAELVVDGDEQELRRAVGNLVDNALLHGAGAIVLGADADGDAIVLWVQDEGRIEPETQAVAFDRFARGPQAADRPGAGLGLALVQAVARRHGGAARIANLARGGVRAEIRLPRPGRAALSAPRPG